MTRCAISKRFVKNAPKREKVIGESDVKSVMAGDKDNKSESTLR